MEDDNFKAKIKVASWRMVPLGPILRSLRWNLRDEGNDNHHSGSNMCGLHGRTTTSTAMCGRTARNNTLLEAFVFPYTLSTQKVGYF